MLDISYLWVYSIGIKKAQEEKKMLKIKTGQIKPSPSLRLSDVKDQKRVLDGLCESSDRLFTECVKSAIESVTMSLSGKNVTEVLCIRSLEWGYGTPLHDTGESLEIFVEAIVEVGVDCYRRVLFGLLDALMISSDQPKSSGYIYGH